MLHPPGCIPSLLVITYQVSCQLSRSFSSPPFPRFVGSLAIHEGALVANYPFDGYPDGSHETKRLKNPSPDDATFVYLAHTYAALHTTMISPNNKVCVGGGGGEKAGFEGEGGLYTATVSPGPEERAFA